ncbi:cysteine desulfurase [archaeon]|nr:MAG: cysteine desulfurase [archaeon]
MNVKKIRNDFPILKRKVDGKPLVFLDSAATSQKPVQVIDAIKEYYEQHNANPHRAIYKLSDEATQLYEKAREDVGKFVNANSEEIVFVRNTSEAMNLVMYGWGMKLSAGDEIVLTQMEHHSNIVPWQLLQKNGVTLKFVDITNEGELDMEELKKFVTKRTRLVSLTHVSNVLGTINNVKEIGKIAHDSGALFFVDGAQSVPHMPVDVNDIGCDFLTFSGHKMLAPMNIGALYGRKDILQGMQPFMYGGNMIKQVSLTRSTWNDLPWKFEAGTPNVEGAVGLSAAISYLKKIGMNDVMKHEEELTKYALEKLSEVNGIKVYGPEERAGLVSFDFGNIHPHDVAEILNSEGIAIRSGHMCAQPLMNRLGVNAVSRASFYIYNMREEIDKLVDGLEKVKTVMKA